MRSSVLLTALPHAEDKLEEALKAGLDSVSSKPLFTDSLIHSIQNIQLQRDTTTEAESGQTLAADDGQAAVDMFAAHPAGYYDAILMDVRMPVMNGLEATRTIRSLERADAREIPIIAMTANAFDEDVQHSLQAGIDAHLSKPVEPDQLYKTLDQMIQRK